MISIGKEPPMGETRSNTKGHHTNLANNKVHETTITDGRDKSTGYGLTPEKSQKAASDKWQEKQSKR
jgi:hypothetical protein